MGDLSRNFNRSEFACKCQCGQDTVDSELLNILQSVRDKFGPVVITSANRCESHNAKEGGSKNSQHLRSRAADIQLCNVVYQDVVDFIAEEFPDTGIGAYSGFIHVDSRGTRARWIG